MCIKKIHKCCMSKAETREKRKRKLLRELDKMEKKTMRKLARIDNLWKVVRGFVAAQRFVVRSKNLVLQKKASQGEVVLKKKRTTMQKPCYIISPFSKLMFIWTFMFSLLMSFSFMYTSMNITFIVETHSSYLLSYDLDIAFDVLTLVNFLVSLITALKEGKQ